MILLIFLAGNTLTCGCDTVVEMPVPFVEKIEKALESLVGNIDFCIVLLYLMNIEHSAIQIWNASINTFKLLIVLRCVESVVEKVDKKSFIELLKKRSSPSRLRVHSNL